MRIAPIFIFCVLALTVATAQTTTNYNLELYQNGTYRLVPCLNCPFGTNILSCASIANCTGFCEAVSNCVANTDFTTSTNFCIGVSNCVSQLFPTNPPSAAIYASKITNDQFTGLPKATWAATNNVYIFTNLLACTVEYWMDGYTGCGNSGGPIYLEYPYEAGLPSLEVSWVNYCASDTNNNPQNGLQIVFYTGADSITNIIGGGLTFPAPLAKMHIAGEATNLDRRIYINGQLVAQNVGLTNFDFSGTLNGAAIVKGVGEIMRVRMHEPRFSNIVRYTNDFIPANSFPVDTNTVALYHFEDGTFNFNYDATSNHIDMYAGYPTCCSTSVDSFVGKDPW